MAWKIPNPAFVGDSANPFTAAAQGLNNIAWTMMSKMKSPEELENIRAQAESNRQLAAYREAQIATEQQKVIDAQTAAQNSEASVPAYMMAQTGLTQSRLSALENGMRNGWGAIPTAGAEDGTGGMSRVATAGDFGFTPDDIRNYRNAQAVTSGVRMTGSKDNVKQIADAQRQFDKNSVVGALEAGARNGDVNAIRALNQFQRADLGKDIYRFGQWGVGDELTGALDSSGQFAQSEIGKNRAQANQANASASEHSAKANQVKLESVEIPVEMSDGTTVNVTKRLGVPAAVKLDVAGQAEEGRTNRFNTAEAGRDRRLGVAEAGKDRRLQQTEAGKNGRAGAKGGGAPKLNPKEETAIIDAIQMATPENMTLPDNHLATIKEWTREYFSSPESPARGNIDKAARLAFVQVYGKATPDGDAQHWIPFRNSRPKGGDLSGVPNRGSVAETLSDGAAPPKPSSGAGAKPNGSKPQRIKFDAQGNIIQ